jgi:hypothetical protein
MQDVDKVTENDKKLKVWMLVSKKIFKRCPESSLCVGFCILNVGLFIVSINVYRSRIRIVVKQIVVISPRKVHAFP